MKRLDQKRMKELFGCDLQAGCLIWRFNKGPRARRGHIAGHIHSSGYRVVIIDKKQYRVSRLMFLWKEGYSPEHQVDHIDRDRSNDSWDNLRHVSRRCNLRNKNIYNTNTSGIAGVSWDKRVNKWQTGIGIDGSIIHLGYFENKIDAAKARWTAEVKYGFPGCNTTSSTYQYLQSH